MTLFAQSESSLYVTGNPYDNYGFFTWEAPDEDPAYYRLEIHELNWEGGDTLSSIADRFEIWDKCFTKVPDAFLKEPEPYTQFILHLQGYDNSHNPMPTVVARLNGPSARKGCHWDCESSDFAYRIQQYERPQGGGWDYHFEMAYETEDDELFLNIPYFRWFSPTQFNTHTELSNEITPKWHNYQSWTTFMNVINDNLNVTKLPHYQVAQLSISSAPSYWDNLGHEITSSQVRGIKKGFGQWYDPFWFWSSINETRVMGFGADFCETTPDLSFMREFMTSQLNINPALTCPPNLGGGGTVGGGLNNDHPSQWGYFDLIKYWRFQHVKKPLGSYGGINPETAESGSPLDQEIIFFNEDNWMSRISDVFAFEEPGTIEERFTSILSESEIFVLERFDERRSVVLNGNFSTFFNADGTPVFPELNLTEGLYRLTVKKKGHAVFFIVFEVRYAFDMQIELKNYFEALLFPNPHTNNHIKANISTTAALRVNYTLYDHMSNRLFSRNFNLPKDHSGEHALNFDGQLPNGFLYHKFTFDDGSYKTYITVKQ